MSNRVVASACRERDNAMRSTIIVLPVRGEYVRSAAGEVRRGSNQQTHSGERHRASRPGVFVLVRYRLRNR